MERLFLGFGVEAPWPEEFPKGRILEEIDRHLTFAFLGEVKRPKLIQPPFRKGFAGQFDAPLFLPTRHPHVAAWHAELLEGETEFLSFRREFPPFEEPFLPHVTIARRPFQVREWKESFQPRPFYLSHFSLYKSLGNSRYEVIWKVPLTPPFEEIEHTADRAFLIRGETLEEMALHARLALGFLHPPLFQHRVQGDSLDALIASLNRAISRTDAEGGCPLKAVSYHGTYEPGQWKMIVDV